MKKSPRLIFYDFEVLSKLKLEDTGHSYWCVVFIDYETRKGKIIKNDVQELKRFYNSTKNDIIIGFNSRNYDQYIYKGLLLGMDAGYINDQLIIHKKKGFEAVRQGYQISLNNFDIMPNPPIGLKTMEAFMGSNIMESSVPFDSESMTEEQEKELITYCIHDVKETIKVFEAKREEFDSQLQLIEAFNLPMTMFSKTKAQLSAHILEAEKHPDRGDEFEHIFPETLLLDKYAFVKDWYDKEFKSYKDEKGKARKLKVDIAGVPTIYGIGGIHSSLNNYVGEGIILSCDIASMYPALIIEYNLMSRNVPSKEKYVQIRDERLKLKALKDPKQQPLKIVLNATFGIFKDQYNPACDKRMSNSICIAGQLLLTDLAEKIEPFCEIIQKNTDGIFMKVDNYEMADKVKKIALEWEKRTRLDLEWDEYKKIYQKDVNNYILIPEKLYNDKGKPNWKVKGAYVKKLSEVDYDLPVVNRALVNYFVHNTPLEQTINEENRLIEFQKVVKCGANYEFASYGEEKLKERVLRVFADNKDTAQGVFKHKWKTNKEGETNLVAEKIGNTPEKCFIDNGDIKGKLIPDYLDKQYYIDLAQKRLNDFLGIKAPRKKKVKEKTDVK